MWTIWLCLLFLTPSALSEPQVFPKITEHCVHIFPGENGGHKEVRFPSISNSISRNNFTIFFNLCTGAPPKECKSATSAACLVSKKDGKVISLGTTFSPFRSPFFGNSLLVSQNGKNCSSRSNYTLKVNLVCSEDVTTKITLYKGENSCEFTVAMMHPTCSPKCTGLAEDQQYLIDLRKLPKNISVLQNNRSFSLTLCGESSSCGSSSISSCEVPFSQNEPMELINLATVESQHVEYDGSKQELTARGYFNKNGVKLDLWVLIKCNWETELSNVTYVQKGRQGRHYKFELESSFGCVKTPQNCLFTNINNINFNLNALYKPQGGFWTVSNFNKPNTKMVLNVCGPLQFLNQNKCKAQHSQVCVIDDSTQQYMNMGSIPSLLTQDDDSLKLDYSSGEKCAENAAKSYSTRIEFRCSNVEKGPKFMSSENCVNYLLWETPQACAVDVYEGTNCSITDRFGHRDFRSLYSENDRVFMVSPSVSVIYNFCGPIRRSCNGQRNASFCLIDNQKETVIGWNDGRIVSKHGTIKLEATGESCRNNLIKRTSVKLQCSYENSSTNALKILSRDECSLDFIYYTSTACLSNSPTFPTCSYVSKENYYDLSSFVSKNKNYVVHDPSGNIDYLLNICGPIVTDSGVQCEGNTMVCMRNNTEGNVAKRFVSIGHVGAPKVINQSGNESLVIEAKMGSFCDDFGYYVSTIHFICSETEEAPVFLSKTECSFDFAWKTRLACARKTKCVMEDTREGENLDFGKIDTRQFNIQTDNNTSYEILLCDYYWWKSTPGKNRKIQVEREFEFVKTGALITLTVVSPDEKHCGTNNITQTVIEFICTRDVTEEDLKETGFSNCTLHLLLRIPKKKCVQNKIHIRQTSEVQSTTEYIQFILKPTEKPSPIEHNEQTKKNGSLSPLVNSDMGPILEVKKRNSSSTVNKQTEQSGSLSPLANSDMGPILEVKKGNSPSSSTVTIIIAISVTCTLLLAGLLIFWLHCKRKFNLRPLIMNRANKSYVEIYSKDSSL